MSKKRRSGLVLCTLNDFDETGKLKPGYRDKRGCWVRWESLTPTTTGARP